MIHSNIYINKHSCYTLFFLNFASSVQIQIPIINYFNRELSLEERNTVTNKTIEVYQDLETLLGSNDFNEDLRKELQKSNPDYPKVISNRIRDLQKADHGLVVSGKDYVSCYSNNIFCSIYFFKKKNMHIEH